MIDSNVFIYAVYLGIYIAIMIGIGIYYGKKSKSMDDYLVAGRSQGFWSITGTMVATSCGAAAFIGFVALLAKGIIPVYILTVKIVGAGLVFLFLALMFWQRATQKGIIAGMIAGVVVTIGWHVAGNPFVMQAVPGYISSLVVMVLVSLLTSHAADEQVRALYFTPADSR